MQPDMEILALLIVMITDTQTGMPARGPTGAICVQGFDDSLNSAIHTTYRISLRSSSLREPRYPLLKVVFSYFFKINTLDRLSIRPSLV